MQDLAGNRLARIACAARGTVNQQVVAKTLKSFKRAHLISLTGFAP